VLYPLELLAFMCYFVSLWLVCFLQALQYFFSSSLSGVFCLFFVVV